MFRCVAGKFNINRPFEGTYRLCLLGLVDPFISGGMGGGGVGADPEAVYKLCFVLQIVIKIMP
jgi:hypothetical protein